MRLHSCAELPANSRIRAICEGKADLPLSKINAYRERWGLGPLREIDGVSPVSAKVRMRRRQPPSIRVIRPGQSVARRTSGGCRSCGGQRKSRIFKPNGYGPGSKLMELMDKAGIPHCPACVEMAGKMDRWGKVGCRHRMKSIVNDILPRAKKWLASDKPIMHRFLSIAHFEETALRMAIQHKVNEAIKLAEERPATRISSRASTHRAEDVSNLLESTLIKPAAWIKGTHPYVEKLPLAAEPIRHLLYHIYPKRNDIWKWNVDLLLPYLPLFNGRRIVAIAVDESTVEADKVKDAFGGAVLEFMVFRNNKKAGEMVSFLPLLAQVQTDDPNVATFRAHAKGTSRFERDLRDHLREWTKLLYTANLADWDQVRKDLEEAAMTGACRKFDQFRKRPPVGKPTYSGSFYWFRNCYVYSRDWQSVDNPRWGCESWPARLFTKQETRCLLIDDTKSMYDSQYWERAVLPQWRRWKEERGL